jgi:WD domain, G-beta repeat
LLLAGSAVGESVLVETKSGEVVARLPIIAGGVECVAFSPEGTCACLGGVDGIRPVDVRKRRLIDESPRITVKAFRCEFSPDSQSLAITGARRTAAVWDLESRKAATTFDTGSEGKIIWSIAFRPDGQFVAVGLKGAENLGAPAEAQVWSIQGSADARPTVRLPHRAPVLSVRFPPTDDRTLLTACADGKARLWNLDTR